MQFPCIHELWLHNAKFPTAWSYRGGKQESDMCRAHLILKVFQGRCLPPSLFFLSHGGKKSRKKGTLVCITKNLKTLQILNKVLQWAEWWPPKDNQVLILGTYKYYLLCPPQVFADLIKLRILKWKGYPSLFRWALNATPCILIRGRQREIKHRYMKEKVIWR